MYIHIYTMYILLNEQYNLHVLYTLIILLKIKTNVFDMTTSMQLN